MFLLSEGHFIQVTLCTVALHYSIDGGRRHFWQVNALTKIISFLSEVVSADWQVIAHIAIDESDMLFIAAFYYVDEAWLMHEILAIFAGAYGS